MSNVATSVRITGDAQATLSKLAVKLGQPKAQVIQRALLELEERVFWCEVQEAFARDAEDPQVHAESKAEFALWDQISTTDFREEQW